MHNLEQPQFESNKEVRKEAPTEADRVRAETSLNLKEFAEEAAVDGVIDKLLDEHLKNLSNPRAQELLKNNKE